VIKTHSEKQAFLCPKTAKKWPKTKNAICEPLLPALLQLCQELSSYKKFGLRAQAALVSIELFLSPLLYA
jgi:hypothetical protein